MRDGRFYPDHGLDRIVEYHERQDARFAEAAAELSEATGKPILAATELAVADPGNAGPAAVRATGTALLPVAATAPWPPSATCTATPAIAADADAGAIVP